MAQLAVTFDVEGSGESAIIWTIIAAASVFSLWQQHVRKRFVQRDILFLLTCNIILRLFWLLRQHYDGGFSNIFLNRVAILVQLTGLVMLFQSWFKKISDNPQMSTKFKYFSIGAVVFSWVFMLATVFQCIKTYCVWYEVNIVFIGFISMGLAVGVLLYGLMVRKRLLDLSSQNLMNSTAYNARLRQANQLFRICGTIVVLFTIRALLFGIGEYVDLRGKNLYPWWYYQIPEGVPHILVLINLMPSDSPVLRTWKKVQSKLCSSKKGEKKRTGLDLMTPIENLPKYSNDL